MGERFVRLEGAPMNDMLPSWPLLAAFLIASFVLAVTPGPGVFYIVTRTLAQGRPSGLASVAGVALGNLGNAVGASVGLAALFAVSSFAALLRQTGETSGSGRAARRESGGPMPLRVVAARRPGRGIRSSRAPAPTAHGYSPTDGRVANMQRYKVEGMTCGHCVRSVTSALGTVPGVSRVHEVSLERGEVLIDGSPDERAVLAAIQEEGYAAQRAE
jgi:copper chaperone CopZ